MGIYITTMRVFTVILFLLFFPLYCYPQTKIYLSAGTNYNTFYFIEDIFVIGKGNQIYVTDGSYQSYKFGRYFYGDLIFEKRIVSGLYGLTGISYFQTGHSNYLDDGPNLGIRTTNMTTSYIGIPLMVRVNFLNFWFIDIGMIGRIPIYAELEEYGLKGTQFELHDKQNIAKYLNQFSLGASIQTSFVHNRFILTWYLTFGKTKIDPALEDVWAVGRWSLLLRDLQPKFDYQVTGLKIGMRLK